MNTSGIMMLQIARPTELIGTFLCLLKEPQAGWTKGDTSDAHPEFSVAVEGRHAMTIVTNPVIALQLAGILTVTSMQGLEVSCEPSDASITCLPFRQDRESMFSIRVSGLLSVTAQQIGEGEVEMSMSPKTAQAVAQGIFLAIADLGLWRTPTSKSSPEPTTPSS